MPPEPAPSAVPIRDLAKYYLRLGLLGFGGPVALVGQMEREMVGDKKWLTKEEMREGLAVCQSLPGPLAGRSGLPHSGGDGGAPDGVDGFDRQMMLLGAAVGIGRSRLFSWLGTKVVISAVTPA